MNNKKRILIIAANPEPEKHGRLDLDQEIREIHEVLQSAQLRDQFELSFPQVAATYRDFQTAILKQKPQIVHICGHVTGTNGLMFCNDAGQAKLVNAEALAGLFELFADQVECVVLNACYSAEQAQAICQHIEYVIGMNQPIGDRSAQEFSFGFYSALGEGGSYEFAYEYGRSSISIGGSAEYADVPKLYRRLLPTTTPSIGIFAWADPPPDRAFTILLDWTAYYKRDTRQIQDQSTWDSILLPKLRQVKKQLRQTAGLEYITVQARAPLTVMLALGFVFPQVDDFRFHFEQVSNPTGKEVWKSYEPPSSLKFRVEEHSEPGADLLIAFSVSGSAKADIDILLQETSQPFSIIYCEPESGASPTSIASNADATALTIDAHRIMQKYIKQYRVTTSHLILYAPLGFCLFLGQKLNALGTVITYERKAQGGYQMSFTLPTG
jgi:hypothetical protein